jgi:hypothetical protein
MRRYQHADTSSSDEDSPGASQKRTSWTPEVCDGPAPPPGAATAALQLPARGMGLSRRPAPLPQEDTRLTELVEKYGPCNWTLISQVRRPALGAAPI